MIILGFDPGLAIVGFGVIHVRILGEKGDKIAPSLNVPTKCPKEALI